MSEVTPGQAPPLTRSPIKVCFAISALRNPPRVIKDFLRRKTGIVFANVSHHAAAAVAAAAVAHGGARHRLCTDLCCFCCCCSHCQTAAVTAAAENPYFAAFPTSPFSRSTLTCSLLLRVTPQVLRALLLCRPSPPHLTPSPTVTPP